MSKKDIPQTNEEETNDSMEDHSASLDELPDTVYVPLGRRGMESISIKVCPNCDKENLTLIQKTTTGTPIRDSPVEDYSPAAKEIVDYRVYCQECGHQFIIRLTQLYFKEEPVQTIVSLLTKKGDPEQWLGNLF